ncbi:unnamed protein product [Mytilus coruscus]|uniref:G-protein coupled receptors family 2 profile 2 domain-containing protein n=1 Tax=Mytilus coruscus TaxID=42192 RepID=A0A6J8DHA6_MYTCO|nr:unnamed protein product [Mytilus coruscus]
MWEYFSIILLFGQNIFGRKLIDSQIENVLEQYHNTCGTGSCLSNNTINDNEFFTMICEICSCNKNCIKEANCCPEVLLHQPKRICFDGIIYRPAMHYVKATTYNRFKIVKECPPYSPVDIRMKCTKNRNVTERFMAIPMTSLNTHLTYDNIYCARCNNDGQNLESWYLDFQCKMKINFNILSSVDEIVTLVIQNNCTIITSPVSNQKSFIESCNSKSVISECNQTGTWLNEDDAVLHACQSVDQPIGMFKNVFCYICNPPIGHKEVITSCPSNNHNISLFQLCNNSLPSASMYPYNNKFCYQCNVNQTLNNAIDVMYKHSVRGHVYYVLPRYCNERSQLAMYDNTTAIVVNTLQMNFTDAQKTNDDIPFTRQWQYMIICPKQEIFSLFYSANDITQESLLRGCNNFEPVSKYEVKCVIKTQLIRECSKPMYTTDMFIILKTACLSFEHNNLVAYKGYYNIFCYMCNLEFLYMEPILCRDQYFLLLFNIKDEICSNVTQHNWDIQLVYCLLCSFNDPITGGSAGYRSMLLLSSYDQFIDIRSSSSHSCSSQQIFDSSLSICRDLRCIPGKVFANNTCIPLLQMTEDLCYIFAVHFDAIISKNAKEAVGIDLIRELTDEAFDNLNTRLKNTSIYGNMKYIIANISCNNINIKTSFSGYLYFDLCTSGVVSRHNIDSNLLHLMNSTVTLNQSDLIMRVNYESDAEAFDVPSLVDNIAVADLCTYQSVISIRVPGKLATYYRVNKLLLCTQVELSTREYEKQRNGEIKLHVSGQLLRRNEYLTVKNNHIRVCSDRYLQLISELPKENIELPMFIIRAICNVISLICLILTFITYVLFKSLRTVPGQNNMTLVLCMILNDFLFHVRLYSLENIYLCQAIGVLQHYFILTVFTSYNMCTFHVYRVFTTSFSTTANSNFHVLLKYKAYIFGFPAVIVTSSILVSFIDNGYQSIGYGGDLCFIVFKLAAIVTFLCPVGIILLSNVIMFAAAIYNICSSPHISSENVSHEKKDNIVIYFKLFAITGCTWLLQFIDALFPESMFTVLISMCNLLTGTFIFMSYICNKRVLELYKSKFKGGNKYLFSGISLNSATNQTTLHS